MFAHIRLLLKKNSQQSNPKNYGGFMKNAVTKIDQWSFIFMLFCWVAFFLVPSLSTIPINPHYIILCATIIVFIFSLVGLGGVTDWRTASQSTIAILGSIVLVLIESWVLLIGRLLS
jgi:hypothetical protein